MTFEEILDNLYAKYGEEFNWLEIRKTDKSFLNKLLSEINNTHPLYEQAKHAVAKCTSNDDVLFLLANGHYAIVHLTYSKMNTQGYPRFREFTDLCSTIEYIQNKFKQEF